MAFQDHALLPWLAVRLPFEAKSTIHKSCKGEHVEAILRHRRLAEYLKLRRVGPTYGIQRVGSVGLAGTAYAADLLYEPAAVAPLVVPYFSWAGFYAGVHGGYARGDHDERVFRMIRTPNSPRTLNANPPEGTLAQH